MQASLQKTAQGIIELHGELSFATAPDLISEIRPVLDSETSLLISLAGVTRADSGGIALLVEWMRLARQRGIALQYLDIPAQMLSIVRVSGLDDILPLTRSE